MKMQETDITYYVTETLIQLAEGVECGGDGALSLLVRTTITLKVVFATSMIFVGRIHSSK